MRSRLLLIAVVLVAALGYEVFHYELHQPEETVSVALPDKGQGFQVLVSGSLSTPGPTDRKLIKDQVAWAAVWPTYFGHLPPPTINFAQQSVVVVADDTRPNSGYGVAIDRVERNGTAAVIHLVQTAPGVGCSTTAKMSRPYTVIRLTAPCGQVTFEEETRTSSCS